MTINVIAPKKIYPKLSDLKRGDVFIPAYEPTMVCMKCFVLENGKTKAVNLKTGEIINMSLDRYVIPCKDATLNVINEPQ